MTTPEQARKLASLWAAGKMVGGDAHEVAIALHERIEQLERQVEELQADAERLNTLESNSWSVHCVGDRWYSVHKTGFKRHQGLREAIDASRKEK